MANNTSCNQIFKNVVCIRATELYIIDGEKIRREQVRTVPTFLFVRTNKQGRRKGGAQGGFAPLALSQGGQKCPFINYNCLKMSKR